MPTTAPVYTNVARPALSPASGQDTEISEAPAMTATTADTRWIQPRARGLTSAWAVSFTPSTMCSATSPTASDAPVGPALVATSVSRLNTPPSLAAGLPMSTIAHSNLVRCGDHSAACQGTVVSAL